MNRKNALYRVFDLTDQDDGRPRVWHRIINGFNIGEELTADEARAVEKTVASSIWRGAFEAAFRKNKKATIYADE